MSEELFLDDETLSETGHDKLLLAKHASMDADTIRATLKSIRENIDVFDSEHLLSLISDVVPEIDAQKDEQPTTTAA